MKMNRIISVIVALLIIGTAASAMPVRNSEGKIQLLCVDGEKSLPLEVESFQLLGMGEDGRYLIYTDQGYLSMQSIMHALSPEEQSRISEMDNVREPEMQLLTKGLRQDDQVKRFQEALIALGFLNGNADGDYGRMTETAVNDFQASLGMEPTGIAEPRLQMLAMSMTQSELVLKGQGTSDTPFASIVERAGIDMKAIFENSLSLDYDDIAGVGFVSDGSMITYEASAERDIDQYTLTLQFGLLLREKQDGSVSVDPAAKVACLCVRRPVIEEITVKSGAIRGTSSIQDVTAELNGVKMEEKGIAILDEQMVDVLANAAEAGELKIRVAGRYNSFDVSADKAQLESIARIGAVAKEALRF